MPAKDPARAPIALGVGTVALRNPAAAARARSRRARIATASLELLRDAFDMLVREDFEQERFYVDVRQAYWDGARRTRRGAQVAEALIDKLEF